MHNLFALIGKQFVLNTRGSSQRSSFQFSSFSPSFFDPLYLSYNPSATIVTRCANDPIDSVLCVDDDVFVDSVSVDCLGDTTDVLYGYYDWCKSGCLNTLEITTGSSLAIAAFIAFYTEGMAIAEAIGSFAIGEIAAIWTYFSCISNCKYQQEILDAITNPAN